MLNDSDCSYRGLPFAVSHLLVQDGTRLSLKLLAEKLSLALSITFSVQIPRNLVLDFHLFDASSSPGPEIMAYLQIEGNPASNHDIVTHILIPPKWVLRKPFCMKTNPHFRLLGWGVGVGSFLFRTLELGTLQMYKYTLEAIK